MKEVYRIINNQHYFQRFTTGKYESVDCDKCIKGYVLVGIDTVDVCNKCGGKGHVRIKVEDL